MLNIFYLVAILISAIIFIKLITKDAKNYMFNGKNLSKTKNTIANLLLYIQNNTKRNGKFVYIRNLKNKYAINKKVYNTTVHAGVIYALKLCEDIFNIENLTELRKSATKYFTDNYLKKIDSEWYVISEQTDKVNLSAIATTILALRDLKNSVSNEILENFGQFLLSMQLPTGEFYDFYDLNTKKGGFDNHNSTGIAIWGLVYMQEEKWLEGVKRGLLFLAQEHNSQKNIDYASILAIEKLLESQNNIFDEKEMSLLKNYLRECGNYLSAEKIENNTKVLDIACKTECLIAIYNCFESDTEFQIHLMKLIDKNIKVLRMVQIQKGTLKGGFPTSIDWKETGVLQTASLITMDTIQHTLLACIKFEKMFKN